MEHIIFEYIYKTPNGTEYKVKSSDYENKLPEFFKAYIDVCNQGYEVSLIVDPVIDISVLTDMIKKCFNSISWAQDTLIGTHNRLVNLHEELIKYAKIHKRTE